MFEDTASVLFGIDGLRITDAEPGPDGTVTAWAVTDYPGSAACPDCGTVSSRAHDRVVTWPKDVRGSSGLVRLCWVKRRWKCEQQGCGRKTFTESLPQVPPRRRVTGRLREQAGAEVAGRGITPAEAARHAGVSWPVAHEAFADLADPVLDEPPAPVAHLGIDEHRRGRPRYEADPAAGEYRLVADRWHTCFFDLCGDQGLLGQVEGRTADDAAYWLACQPAAWRDAVRVAAIGMCSIYASAVRRMLPDAVLVVDLFHVVQLAVKMTGDVRRRATPQKYGRRGRSGDPEYGIKRLLGRNLENLSPGQFAKIVAILNADRHGQQAAAAWIGKELLRDALNLRARITGSTPCERTGCSASTTGAPATTTSPNSSPWSGQSPAGRTRSPPPCSPGSVTRKQKASTGSPSSKPARPIPSATLRTRGRRVRTACNRAARRQTHNVTNRPPPTVISRKPNPGYCNFEEPKSCRLASRVEWAAKIKELSMTTYRCTQSGVAAWMVWVSAQAILVSRT